jgi:hypothetical protein
MGGRISNFFENMVFGPCQQRYLNVVTLVNDFSILSIIICRMYAGEGERDNEK